MELLETYTLKENMVLDRIGVNDWRYRHIRRKKVLTIRNKKIIGELERIYNTYRDMLGKSDFLLEFVFVLLAGEAEKVVE